MDEHGCRYGDQAERQQLAPTVEHGQRSVLATDVTRGQGDPSPTPTPNAAQTWAHPGREREARERQAEGGQQPRARVQPVPGSASAATPAIASETPSTALARMSSNRSLGIGAARPTSCVGSTPGPNAAATPATGASAAVRGTGTGRAGQLRSRRPVRGDRRHAEGECLCEQPRHAERRRGRQQPRTCSRTPSRSSPRSTTPCRGASSVVFDARPHRIERCVRHHRGERRPAGIAGQQVRLERQRPNVIHITRPRSAPASRGRRAMSRSCQLLPELATRACSIAS